MNGEVVRYDPERASRDAQSRRRREEAAVAMPSQPVVCLPSLHLSDEVREQLDAYLAAASERDPAGAEFTDLMTASLGALLSIQALRTMREMEERLSVRLRY